MTTNNDYDRLSNTHFIDGKAVAGANPDQFQVVSPVHEVGLCGLRKQPMMNSRDA